jgi:hypothetical protein
MVAPTPTTAKLMAIITTLQAHIVALQNAAPAALAGNVGCRHVSQRVKTTDIFYVGDMSADMSADMSPTCPKDMSVTDR